MSGVPLYGLVAEFSTAEQLLTAVARVRREARHATWKRTRHFRSRDCTRPSERSAITLRSSC